MRKTFVLAAFLVMCVCSNNAFALMYSFTPSPGDLYDLDHSYAYSWGIGQLLASNEKICSAYLTFDNINDWQIESNDILYVRLFDSARLGVKAFPDNEAYGDYFSGRGTGLFTWTDDNEYYYWEGRRWRRHKVWVNPAEDYTYNFNDFQLTKLTDYIKDGNFGFGFDPDCHYYNDGVTFTFETCHTPEPATMSLLGLGIFGLAKFRRKK